MDSRDSMDDELTLVSTMGSEQTLLPEFHSDSALDILGPCHPLDLPIEIRRKIYRYLCISEHNRTSHPRLWRPTGCEGSWGRIGYFERGTVIPLLSLCHQIHDEAAAVLYGENLFAFHISELSQGPILFFSWLAPRYVQLLRKVHIRSGFNVDTYDKDHFDGWIIHSKHKLTPELMDYRAAKNLALSAAIVKQAWPKEYRVCINKIDTLNYLEKDDESICKRSNAIDWPAGSYHLWKMVITDTPAGTFEPEFRRTALTRRKHSDLESPDQDARSSAGMFHD